MSEIRDKEKPTIKNKKINIRGNIFKMIDILNKND